MAKILVVDDEEGIVEVFVEFLAQEGFEVISASGGGEAIGLLKAGVAMDLMILDMKMPRITGLDVLKVKKDLQDIRPVIILTGSMGQEKIYKDLEGLGFRREDVIYKPVNLLLLLDEVKKKLGMNRYL